MAAVNIGKIVTLLWNIPSERLHAWFGFFVLVYARLLVNEPSFNSFLCKVLFAAGANFQRPSMLSACDHVASLRYAQQQPDAPGVLLSLRSAKIGSIEETRFVVFCAARSLLAKLCSMQPLTETCINLARVIELSIASTCIQSLHVALVKLVRALTSSSEQTEIQQLALRQLLLQFLRVFSQLPVLVTWGI
eukprot:2593640-Amphidinium_carterae.2